MEMKEAKSLAKEKIEKQKERLIKTRKFLNTYNKDLTSTIGIASLVLYMANVDSVEGGVVVQSIIGTVFVGCAAADTYLGSKIAVDMIDNKLETGFKEEVDYQVYKLTKNDNSKKRVKRLKK